MAIGGGGGGGGDGGGGGGGGGGVKKESNPTALDALSRADPSTESHGSQLLAKNGAARGELSPGGSLLRIAPQEFSSRLGARPPRDSNGRVVLGKNGAGNAKEPENSRGSICNDDSKKPLSQAYGGEALPEVKDSEASKRAKYSGVNLTTQNSHSKEFYSNNNIQGDSNCKGTPPLDWLKRQKRLSISMNPSRAIKTLSFSGLANTPQQAQANVSSTTQVSSATSIYPSSSKPAPENLIVKLNPIKKNESVPAFENNNKKKIRKTWEDITGGAGVWDVGESSSKAQGCYTHSNSHIANHSIFLCQCERSQYDQKLTELAKGLIARNICIPGSTVETEVMTRGACKIIEGIVKSITNSHRNLMCYLGRFGLKNFFSNKDGDVKMDGVHPVPLTSQGVKQDKKRAAAVIRKEYFLDRVVPSGIERLLLLLESEEAHNEELIDYHSSFQPPLKRIALCELMIRNMIGVKRTDQKKYQAIVAEVEKKVDCQVWKIPVEQNTHLNKVLLYINPATNKPTNYADTAEGLLHYMYNSIKHLNDHAYEDGVLQYTDDEINDILSGTLAGIIEAFQEAMFHQKRMFKFD